MDTHKSIKMKSFVSCTAPAVTTLYTLAITAKQESLLNSSIDLMSILATILEMMVKKWFIENCRYGSWTENLSSVENMSMSPDTSGSIGVLSYKFSCTRFASSATSFSTTTTNPIQY